MTYPGTHTNKTQAHKHIQKMYACAHARMLPSSKTDSTRHLDDFYHVAHAMVLQNGKIQVSLLLTRALAELDERRHRGDNRHSTLGCTVKLGYGRERVTGCGIVCSEREREREEGNKR